MTISEDMVAQARQGSREAFGRLYESVAGELYRQAWYLLGNREEAEDAVSETFLEAWKGIGRLKNAGSFRPWIFKILSMRCKGKISGLIEARTNVNLDDWQEEGREENGFSRVELMEAVSRLNFEERQVIVLGFIMGYTGREISEMTGWPQGTITSKQTRTLKKLRGMLSGKEE